MDDDQIIARGGDEYDIAAYAEANGATDVLKGMTIEEVLDDFGHAVANGATRDGKEVKQALAVIKQLVLDEVIGEDESHLEIFVSDAINIAVARNELREGQRQALEKVMVGK